MTSQKTTLPPFGLKDKVGYALGDLACNLSFTLITKFLADFYTQYIGLSEVTWAMIIIGLKIWDGINDPIMGSIVDRKRISPKSKYKPWIKIGALGLVVFGALAFLPIPKANYGVKVFVCIVTYMAFDMFYTLVNVPYGSMNSTISSDRNERTALSTFRSIGAAIGGLVAVILPLFVYENGVLMGERFIWIALLLGGTAFFVYHACLKLTTERVEPEIVVDVKLNYVDTLKRVLTNRPLIALALASFSSIVFLGSVGQTSQWIFQVYFKNTDMITVATIVTSIPIALVLPFVGKLSKRFGKKLTAGVPLFLSAVVSLVYIFIPLTTKDNSGTFLYLVGLMFVQLGGGLFNFVVWAMITDCIDYQELKTGVREEGSVYAIYSFFRKLAQGASQSLIILTMAWVGYKASEGPNQQAGVGANMVRMSFGLMFIGSIIMLVALLVFYNINLKKEISLRTELGRGNDEKSIDINQAVENLRD